MPLGAAAPPVLGSLLVTAEDEGLMKGVRGPWEHSAQSASPSFPVTSSKSSHICQPHLCLQIPFLGLLLSRGPSPGVHSARPCLPPSLPIPWPCHLLMAGLPLPRQALTPVWVPGAGCATAGGGCLMEQGGMRSCCWGPLQLLGDQDRPCGDLCCTLVLAQQGRRAQF